MYRREFEVAKSMFESKNFESLLRHVASMLNRSRDLHINLGNILRNSVAIKAYLDERNSEVTVRVYTLNSYIEMKYNFETGGGTIEVIPLESGRREGVIMTG